jgi:hypothetical protein
MTSLTDTQVITASGGLVELGYSQITSGYTTTTTSATNTTTFVGPVTIVSDGSPLEVEFFCPSAFNAAAGGSQVIVNLVVDGAVQGYIAGNYSAFANTSQSVALSGHRRITLSAGSHTIGASAWHAGAAGFLNAGTGSGTGWSPTFIRVSKIVQATQWPAVTTGTIICTSSTRPAAPFEGQTIYETDTKKELTYTGAAWTESKQFRTAGGSVVDNYRVPPACRVVRTSDASFTNNTAVTFQSASSGDSGIDTDSMFSAGSPTRITIQTAGIYLVVFTPYITGASITYQQPYLRVDGTTIIAESDASTAQTTSAPGNVTAVYPFTASQYIEGLVQMSGTGLTQKGTIIRSALSATWLGQAS